MQKIFGYLMLLSVLAVQSVYAQNNSANEITGIVKDRQGNLIEGASVKAFIKYDIVTEEFTGNTNSSGEYRIQVDELSYPYRLMISHPDYKSQVLTISNSRQRNPVVELESSVISFNYVGKLVSDNDNRPLTDFRIRFDDFGNAFTPEVGEVSTDSEGIFELPLTLNLNDPQREFYISINKAGFREIRAKVSYESNNPDIDIIEIRDQLPNISLSGSIVDIRSNEPIDLATVQILNEDENIRFASPIGTSTELDGSFEINLRNIPLPYEIEISHVSFESRKITIKEENRSDLRVRLSPKSVYGEDIVVTADMIAEEELKETRTIDKVNTVDIQQVASFSAFDLVASLREVDIATQSMNLQSVSTRGFNASANPRFLQLTDGIDNLAPGLGFPVGNLLGPSELDISSIELIVGSASARYGSSAMNGVLLTSSRNVFLDRGFTFSAKTGAHNLNAGSNSALGLQSDGVSEASFRYAGVLKDKLGLKLTGTFIQGTDWSANNYENIGPGRLTLDRNEVAGYNGVNIYGDESFELLATGVDEDGEPTNEIVPTTRTGYREVDLVDYDILTYKAAAELAYKFSKESFLSFEGRYGLTNTLYTSDSRIRLEDFEVLQFRTQLNINSFNISAYRTSQNSGSSYNINYLAEQLILEAKSDFDWYRDFEIAFSQGLPFAGIPRGSLEFARRFADGGSTLIQNRLDLVQERFRPGTERFDQKVEEIKQRADFDGGAGIRDNSILYHTDITQKIEELGITAGVSGRFYDIDSEGTIFPDTTGNNITNFEVGSFLQYEDSFFEDQLGMIASVRVDKNENFDIMSSQQVGFNYSASEKQFWRFSIQNSFRFPTVREQFLNTDIGKARLLGGLSLIHDEYDLQGNAFFEESVDDYYEQVQFAAPDTGVSAQPPPGRRQAELTYLPTLQAGIVTSDDLKGVKPEKVISFETGMRRLFNENLFLDLNYFISFYNDFIGVKRFIKPKTSPQTDLYASASQSLNSTEHDVFFVYSNSDEAVIAQGAAFNLRYSSGSFFTGLNGTWANLISDVNDPIVPGYNTPPFKFNFEWGNKQLITNLGFKFNFRFRTAYDWQSSFIDGRVESYGHLDFQFNLRLPKAYSMLKFGVTNYGVRNYADVYGGSRIGSILFVSLNYDPKVF